MKIHGSALEYTVRPHPERFLPYALEGIRGANGVLVGSHHTGESLFEVLADEPSLRERTRLGPPGVDVHTFRRREPNLGAPVRERRGLGRRGGRAPTCFAALDLSTDRIVSFLGKLIVSKGVDLLFAAWPLVVDRVPGRAAARDRLRDLSRGARRASSMRCARADVEALREIAARGRELEGRAARRAQVPAGLPRHRRRRLAACRAAAAERIHFTGRLEHDDLPDLLPAVEAQVMPSTFPESFGMVAAEAAACGALPLSANHSGMAEVTATLAPALPPELRPLMSFEVGPGAVREIAEKLVTWLTLDPDGARAGARRAGRGCRSPVLLGERCGGRDRGRVQPLQWVVFPPREPHPEHPRGGAVRRRGHAAPRGVRARRA